MITVWERLKRELPSYASVIGASISKLKEYWKLVENVPAYTLAQSEIDELIHCMPPN
jgi:hypothetical protein